MSKLKKAFGLSLIVMVFLCQNAVFCLPETKTTLRPPLITSKTLMELSILEKLEEYLKREDRNVEDGDRDDVIVEEIQDMGKDAIEALGNLLAEDKRSWMRARIAVLLERLYDDENKEILDSLFRQLAQDESVLVRSIIARWSLPEIKKRVSKDDSKKIKKHIKDADLNPWSEDNVLKILDVGCEFGGVSHGVAKYYKDSGVAALRLVGVDMAYDGIIEAEKKRTDSDIVFVYGDIDECRFGPVDIVLSRNLLLSVPTKKHAKSLFRQLKDDDGKIDGGEIYYSPSVYSEGESGSQEMSSMNGDLGKLIGKLKLPSPTKLGLLSNHQYKKIDYNQPFGGEALNMFGSYWPNSYGWVIARLPSRLNVIKGSEFIKIKTTRFPDGEFNLRILNPSIVDNAELTVTSPLDSADDLVKLVLLMDTLRMYDAKNINLIVDQPYEIDNGLDGLLRYFCDTISYMDGFNKRTSDVKPLEFLKEKKGPVWIDHVLYQHERLEGDARQAAEVVNAKSSRIEIVKEDENPLKWEVDLPDDLKAENVVLVHSTENSMDIAELWIMLIALRKAGISNVSLINTYEGYARQDKVFNEGEGISSVTMLKAVDFLLDHHMALNVHYADKSGLFVFDGYEIYNLNAFIQVAEGLFDTVVGWLGRESLVENFKANPLLLVGPDDGALGYVKEAAERLKISIKEKYGIDIDVHFGYMDKIRLGGKKVKISGSVLTEKGQPISVVDPKDCWVFVLDDETSWGSTLFAADYALVRKAGVPWYRVLTGVVHAKLAQGLEPFKTGWKEQEILDAVKDGKDIEPKPEHIDESSEWMPPRLFMCTRTISLPLDHPDKSSTSVGQIVGFAVKRLIGLGRQRRNIFTDFFRQRKKIDPWLKSGRKHSDQL